MIKTISIDTDSGYYSLGWKDGFEDRSFNTEYSKTISLLEYSKGYQDGLRASIRSNLDGRKAFEEMESQGIINKIKNKMINIF